MRRLGSKQQSAASGFHGPGLSFDSIQPAAAALSDLELLQQENERLREQLKYKEQLLQAWQPTCSSCGHQGSDGVPQPATAAQAAVQGSLSRVIRQQAVLIAQLQRQVLVLQVELSSREQLVLEADATLAEAQRRLSSLAPRHSSSASAMSSMAPPASLARGLSSRQGSAGLQSQHGSSRTAAPVPCADSGSSAAAELTQARVDELLGWSRSAAARISRARAESAARCRSARSLSSSRVTTEWQSPGDAHSSSSTDEGVLASSLQQLQLQHIAAGNNAYIQGTSAAAALSLPAICQGSAAAALHPPALQHLLLQLSSLAQPLAELAVQLRVVVLPTLPWLLHTADGDASADLPRRCADAAQAAAAAASELVQVCSVLPVSPGCLLRPDVGDSNRACGDEAAAATELEPEDQQLLERLSKALCGASSSSSSKAPPRQQGRAPAAAAGMLLLHQLRQRWREIWFKKQVLEQQCGFLAQCSAEQARLVSGLVQRVAAGMAAAVDAAEADGQIEQRREAALRLLLQLQRAALLLKQQQQCLAGSGEASSAAATASLRGVARILEQQWDVLHDAAQLLQDSSAAAIKAAGMRAVQAAFDELDKAQVAAAAEHH